MDLAPMLERLAPIHRVTHLTLRGNAIECELATIKVVCNDAGR
ncbi:MAG: hypothetical protein ACREDV_09215 [Methylocella sp.]